MSENSFSELRTHLDSNDTFVSGGHGIIKTAGATRHAERMKRVPVWALDDEKVKQLIRYRFPRAATSPNQRRLAARMLRLIYLYYRVGSTTGAVAEELKMSLNAVKCMIRRINKAMEEPLRPSHRPKTGLKKGDPIDASNGSSGQGHITL